MSVTLALSVDGLTAQAAWIAGLAVGALVLAGWRKPARAKGRPPRVPWVRERQPIAVDHDPAPLYRRPGPIRRILAAIASGGLAVVTGAIAATVVVVRRGLDGRAADEPSQEVTSNGDGPAMTGPSRRDVVIAGHSSDPATATAGLTSPDPAVRLAALGALDRLGRLTAPDLTTATIDPAASVRRRAAELAASRPEVELLPLLADDDVTVVEMAAWSCGERQEVSDAVLGRLIELTTRATEPLVRESCAAALGAIGDARGLPAILAACEDKPSVRRRAVLALAPFDGDDVRAAIERALDDRDWQVRQAAEDLWRAWSG